MKSITGESLTSNHINFLLNRKQREIVNVCRNSINKRNYLHIKTKKCSASIILYLVIRYYTTLNMLTVFLSKCVIIYILILKQETYYHSFLLHMIFWGDRDYSTSWKLNQLFILKSREHYENWFWKEYLCKSWDVYINTLDFNLYLYRRISATLDVIFAVIKLIAFIAMRIHVALTECYDMHA